MSDKDFLEPERLRAFVAVAEIGNFSRAAERLRLAQPTVSIQIRRLEEAIGRSLFDRGTTSATLTKDGEVMLVYARELLDAMERARRQFLQPPLEGSVRLGIVEDFNFTALPELLGSLRARHDQFELSIEMACATELLNGLRTNALDLVLTKAVSGGTDGEPICRQKMVWVGKQGLLEGDVVPLALTPPRTVTREIILRALRGAGLRWSIRLEAPSLAGLQAAVAAGLAVSAFGVGMVPPELAHLSLVEGLPPLEPAEFALGVNPDSKDPVVATFADFVRRMVPLIVARLEEEQMTPPT